METVLLFGGRSFLGGHVCRALVNKGYRVLLHSTSSSNFENLCDILPSSSITPVICKYDDHIEIENHPDFLLAPVWRNFFEVDDAHQRMLRF